MDNKTRNRQSDCILIVGSSPFGYTYTMQPDKSIAEASLTATAIKLAGHTVFGVWKVYMKPAK